MYGYALPDHKSDESDEKSLVTEGWHGDEAYDVE